MQCSSQTVAKIAKALVAAEKEVKSQRIVTDPIEKAIAEAKSKLNDAMGPNKLGSMLELEDLEVMSTRENELVCDGTGFFSIKYAYILIRLL
jgi:hypothetical protein